MHKTINWGIIGLGNIAHKFATDLLTVEGAKLYAVASRNQEKADVFAAKYNAIKAYDSYETLAKNKIIDAVYIATPHALHKENTLLCLDNGIAVLCEKPFAMDSNEVHEMIAKAKEKNVLLMEALWTYFLPHYQYVLKALENQVSGVGYQATEDAAVTNNTSGEDVEEIQQEEEEEETELEESGTVGVTDTQLFELEQQPDESTPEDTVRDESTPEDTVRDESTPEDTVSDEPLPEPTYTTTTTLIVRKAPENTDLTTASDDFLNDYVAQVLLDVGLDMQDTAIIQNVLWFDEEDNLIRTVQYTAPDSVDRRRSSVLYRKKRATATSFELVFQPTTNSGSVENMMDSLSQSETVQQSTRQVSTYCEDEVCPAYINACINNPCPDGVTCQDKEVCMYR